MSTARRVLVLHGFTQNASIFSKRLGALRKQAKDVEMVFLDGPHILEYADIPGDPTALGGASTSLEDPSLIPRAWWRWKPDSQKAEGLEETLVFLRDRLNVERFDGVMGFSQGAALAGLLSALCPHDSKQQLEHPERYPPFLVDGQPPHPPFKFCVAVSGFKLLDSLSHEIFSSGYSTPTLHVLGKTDIVVTEERSNMLLEVSRNQRLETHEGGHFVPTKSNWGRFLAEFLRSAPSPDIPSPSAIKAAESASSSAAPSGRATPVTGEQEQGGSANGKFVASL
ncbi:hypothetical protein D9758_005416 [Tetrapyrgos nigripes]|uniref:Serine hydrolase domain-containing protein n=1 Tax=Tetrapyrgos nigripes TaxID=182062 RepID=A0A8H5GIG7_9AGAR|nr:hypothetical protein D9758_005416 [Tetrapyrgos nigripes]